MTDSTVFKFTRKLDFEGFRDFRGELAAEGFDPEISIHEHITRKSTPAQMVEIVFESTIRSLADTKELLSEQDITRAAKLIERCHQLFIKLLFDRSEIDEVVQNHGLGLELVRKIVEQLIGGKENVSVNARHAPKVDSLDLNVIPSFLSQDTVDVHLGDDARTNSEAANGTDLHCDYLQRKY